MCVNASRLGHVVFRMILLFAADKGVVSIGFSDIVKEFRIHRVGIVAVQRLKALTI